MIDRISKKLKSLFSKLLLDAVINKAMGMYPSLKFTNFGRLFVEFIAHNIEFVDFNTEENLIYLKKDNVYFVTTPDYPWIIREIFCRYIYFLNAPYLKFDDYVVFDFGMNRGYATLYFASQPWCSWVHGFELEHNNFRIAEKNIALNSSLSKKISLYDFGLGNKDGKIETYYFPNRDGITSYSMDFLKSYAPEELGRIVKTENSIKVASSCLKEINGKNNISHVILKIDVEGAEYDIINNLVSEFPDFFNKVEIIIGDAHMGLGPLVSALEPFGFKECSLRGTATSQTSDFLFVKI